MSFSVECHPLHVPRLDEVAVILQHKLAENFKDVTVEVTDCPDLREAPFILPAGGLSGAPRIAGIGGVSYLLPLPNKKKNYNFVELAKLMDLPEAFIIGAGAGPHQFIGANSELMPNIKTGSQIINGSRYSKMVGDQYEVGLLPNDQPLGSLMEDIFACKGEPGKVLKILARNRTGPENFVTCMRKALLAKYGKQSVALGGLFLVNSGSVRCHIMPEFSTEPLNTDEDVNNWLRFFSMPAPMIFFSTFLSYDPGLDYRIEHTHGYGPTCGGHYHYDVTPEQIEYEGYFNIAEFVYRIDRPQTSRSFVGN